MLPPDEEPIEITMFAAARATIGIVPRETVPGGGAGRDARQTEAGARSSSTEADERVGARVDDQTLVRETLAGKRWAQREVWYRFAPMVYGLLRRSLGLRHEHDDLVQEVFLRVFRRLHTLEKPEALRSFVYSVAVRVVSEEIRHFYVRQRARDNMAFLTPVGGAQGADFEAREALVRVQRILDGLKDKHRAVFVLRHVDGMELREIAVGLDISLATVKRYLSKADRSVHRAVARDEGLRSVLGAWLSQKGQEGST
jgi:RNA polymerase sigma-70 factor (ECF subfamily)